MSGFAGTSANGGTGNAQINVTGANGHGLGTQLEQLMLCDELTPGSEVGYQLAKIIYTYHPLGAKMAETPIKMAMSQKREISVPRAPDAVIDAFNAGWETLACDKNVMNTMRLSRVYGVSSVVVGAMGVDTDKPLDMGKISNLQLYFNVLDPLNTSGSMVTNQDPNSPDFQKHQDIVVQGKQYHRSRACVIMNESPIYIEYTNSAFGYVGRSVYQRALFPLKSFLQTMLTDDMISQKAGVIVAKIKPAGSIANKLMSGFQSLKRQLLVGSRNYNVLSITPDEEIESLNLTNIDGAASMARTNILKNIAIAADMPGQMLANEAFVEGFSEGTEDAKNVAHYVDGIRHTDMAPLYKFFDNIVQHFAWSESFFETMKTQFPETYGNMEYKQAFFEWKNDFTAKWPSLLSEPDSEKIKIDESKLKALKDLFDSLFPNLDPDNKVRLIQWVAANANENVMLFTTPLTLDAETLQAFLVEQVEAAKAAAEAATMGQPGQNEGGQGAAADKVGTEAQAGSTKPVGGAENGAEPTDDAQTETPDMKQAA